MFLNALGVQGARICRLTVCFIVSLSLSGCGLIEKDFGSLVSSAYNAADGVVGFGTDENGEILYVCCHTACIPSESAEEFKKKFKQKFIGELIQKVTDPVKQDKLLKSISFEDKPVELCSISPTIEIIFGRNLARQGWFEIGRAELDFSDIEGGKISEAKEKEIKAVIDGFAKEFAVRNDALLKFVIPTCPEVQPYTPPARDCDDPVAQLVDSMLLEEGGGASPEALTAGSEGGCQDCVAPPTTYREYPLNDDALKFLEGALSKAANRINSTK